MADIQKHIEDLQYKQAAVTESLGENQERMAHYEKLLDEARNREPEQEENISDQEKEKKTQIFFEIENEDDLRTIYVGEMKMLLERIDKCINLVGHNRNQCKNELKNLRYHLRSIISEAENSKNQ